MRKKNGGRGTTGDGVQSSRTVEEGELDWTGGAKKGMGIGDKSDDVMM